MITIISFFITLYSIFSPLSEDEKNFYATNLYFDCTAGDKETADGTVLVYQFLLGPLLGPVNH